jgi:hypothetical protein
MHRFLLIAFVLMPSLVFAQTEVDAVRYSQRGLNGSARFVGLGGAMQALGGDLTTLSYNPAGLGIIRNFEISGSLGINTLSSNTTHYGNEVYNSIPRLSIDQLGFGGPSEIALKGKWSNLSLGLSYNRQNNYHRVVEIEGVNPESTLLDGFQAVLNSNNGVYDENNPPSFYPYSVDLAWNTLLLDTFNNRYFNQIFENNTFQKKRITRAGSLNELSIGASANYDYKLYLGASLNIQNLEYSETNLFSETTAEDDTVSVIDEYNFEETLTISSGGANLRLGLIYRISDYLRFGASFQTPTLFNLTDQFDAYIEANYEAGTLDSYPVNPLYFEYRFIGPYRASGGFAALFGKQGLLSVDYEFVDYRTGRFSEKNAYPWNTDGLNSNIKSNLTFTHTVRSGLEYRFGNFTARGGYVFSQDPYSNKLAINRGFRSTSFGLGYRKEGWYIDFTLQSVAFEKYEYYLYNPELTPLQPTTIENRDFKALFTLGIKY